MNHFIHPKNQGKLKDADGVGQAGNPVCGDIMKIYFKIKKQGKKEIVSNIKFETLGCATAIANSSVLTEAVKGKSLEEAMKITNKDLIRALGGDVPKLKIHCSFLALEAFHKAVKDYRGRINKKKK